MSDTQVAKTKQEAPAQARRVQYLRPHYEIAQDKEAYTVKVYLPGVSKEGVNVTVDKDTLSVEAQRSKLGADGWKPRYREIPEADYRLRLDLNVPVDSDNISAKTEQGVLTITLPVAEEAKPRRISIS